MCSRDVLYTSSDLLQQPWALTCLRLCQTGTRSPATCHFSSASGFFSSSAALFGAEPHQGSHVGQHHPEAEAGEHPRHRRPGPEAGARFQRRHRLPGEGQPASGQRPVRGPGRQRRGARKRRGEAVDRRAEVPHREAAPFQWRQQGRRCCYGTQAVVGEAATPPPPPPLLLPFHFLVTPSEMQIPDYVLNAVLCFFAFLPQDKLRDERSMSTLAMVSTVCLCSTACVMYASRGDRVPPAFSPPPPPKTHSSSPLVLTSPNQPDLNAAF